MRAFKFYPSNKAKFHFGNSMANITETFSSDQLYSALFNCFVLLYGAKEANKILVESTLSLTSLFWGFKFTNKNSGEGKELFFLPRPLAPFEQQVSQNLLLHKKTKKIQYFSLEAFKRIQKSWEESSQQFTFDLLGLETIGEKFACTKAELMSLNLDSADIKNLKFFRVQSNPRLVISRANDESENFYYQEALEVAYQRVNDYEVSPFMYFIWRGDLDQRLNAVIRLMADEGLGGKRSQGMGSFDGVEEEKLPVDLFAGESEYYTSLSVLYPRIDEVDKVVFYDLIERSGFLHSQLGRPLRKKRVNLLKEGSVFSGRVTGQLIDVRPSNFSNQPANLNGKGIILLFGDA